MSTNLPTKASGEYRDFIHSLKERIGSARVSAARHINREMILLYWDIGRAIVEKQQVLGWGDSVVNMVAADLQREFPDAKGFSSRNIWDMRRFYGAYSAPDFVTLATSQETTVAPEQFLPQLVAEMPWGHHRFLLNKVSDPAARLYYLRATARFGWSRAVLLNQIKAGAYERAVADIKIHNFPAALPAHLAEQADEMLKSSYNLEFLGIRRAVHERELESRLVEKLQEFLLELGYGFCFIGRQHRMVLQNKEYFVDLLFYHRILKALVAFDLKVVPFEPEFAGKMDFYLNLLNDRERGPDDQPSIGVILCAEKDDVEVEYALRSKGNPIGVAEYQLQPKLPAELKGKLPTAKQLAGVVKEVLAEQEAGDK
jgi:predicted nuclease of restriction endonuclease-like (RecB) superfamily